jgi:DNA-binding response OmpR family regulator
MPRVLIVEDQPLIALDLQSALESHGFEVVGPAAGVSDARQLIANQELDAALIDFVLADGEAQPLADLLNAKGIPFALCTGGDTYEMSARYPHAPVLTKPYKIEEIVHMHPVSPEIRS